MNMLSLVVLAGAALALTFGVGYLALRASTSFSVRDSLEFSGLAGCAVLGAVTFVTFLLGWSSPPVLVAATLLLSVTAGFLAQHRERLVPQRPFRIRRILSVTSSLRVPSWSVAASLGCIWVIALCTQLLVPVYGQALWYGDWWMHFDLSRLYVGLQSLNATYFSLYTVPSRTPLFNLYEGYFLSITGGGFPAYQVTEVLPALACVTACLSMVNRRSGALFLALIAINPFVANQITYPWPKMMAAGYVVVSVVLFRRLIEDSRSATSNLVFAGIAAGLALLAHPSSLIYIAALCALYLWQVRLPWPRRMTHAGVLWFVVGLTMLPWIAWITTTYGPMALVRSSPVAEQDGISLVGWAGERLINIVTTMFPVPLGMISADSVLDPILRTYYSTLPGALTFSVTILLLQFIRRSQLQRAAFILPRSWLVLLLVVGLVAGVLLQPGMTLGIAAESMTPLVLIGLALAADVATASRPQVRVLLIAGVLLEFMISRGSYLLLLVTNQSVDAWSPTDAANLVLKSAHNLVFARDSMDSTVAVLAGIPLFAALAFIVLRALFSADSRQRSASELIEDTAHSRLAFDV